jgi:hypothetical protein
MIKKEKSFAYDKKWITTSSVVMTKKVRLDPESIIKKKNLSPTIRNGLPSRAG